MMHDCVRGMIMRTCKFPENITQSESPKSYPYNTKCVLQSLFHLKTIHIKVNRFDCTIEGRQL